MNAASASERVFGVRAPMSVGVIGNGRAMLVVWLVVSCVIVCRAAKEKAAGFIIPSQRSVLALSVKVT